MNVELLERFPAVPQRGEHEPPDVYVDANFDAALWLLEHAPAIQKALQSVVPADEWIGIGDALKLAAEHGVVVGREGLRKAATQRGYIAWRKTTTNFYEFNKVDVVRWATTPAYHVEGRPRNARVE